jgi:hypothetical protein
MSQNIIIIIFINIIVFFILMYMYFIFTMDTSKPDNIIITKDEQQFDFINKNLFKNFNKSISLCINKDLYIYANNIKLYKTTYSILLKLLVKLKKQEKLLDKKKNKTNPEEDIGDPEEHKENQRKLQKEIDNLKKKIDFYEKKLININCDINNITHCNKQLL